MARQVFWIGVVAALALLGLWNLSAMLGQPSSDLFSPLFQVFGLVRDHFYRPERFDPQRMLEGSLRGSLSVLDDPYTRYLNAEQYARFNTDLQGEFVGVGIRITIRDGQLLIISPIRGGPAERAGVRAGDVILTIDGRPTEGLTLDEAVELLRGREGEPVTLEVRHRDGTEETLVIVRELIRIESVEHRLLTDARGDPIGYVRINSFNRHTEDELEEALQDLGRQGIIGLVLDLRDNPGGLLEEAVAVGSQFVDDGLILSARSRTGTTPYRSRGNDWPNWPLAVLINEGTASAGEIVAGAIKDARMGVLVGRPSFGKGVIQTTFPLPDGSALVLTTAEYLTPAGHPVQDQGLVPDLVVSSAFDLILQAQARLRELKPLLFSREAHRLVDELLHTLDSLLAEAHTDFEGTEATAKAQVASAQRTLQAQRALLLASADEDITARLDDLAKLLQTLNEAVERPALRVALEWIAARRGQLCPCEPIASTALATPAPAPSVP